MTYTAGGLIQASDYNTFATQTSSMNEVYADLHPGATTLAALADFGYGQTALTSVIAGANVHASEWSSLFQAMRNCGTHQGTTVVPPLPATNPVVGNNIVAQNSPTSLASLITTLRTNRHNLAVGQSTLTTGTTFTQPGAVIPWTNTLTWNGLVDFGSWNNARYFFNAGGFIGLNGGYSPVSTPEDAQWVSMLAALSPLKFTWNSSTPNSGSGGTSIGFYNLTTSDQSIYLKNFGSGAYSASTLQVFARLSAAAGTNGQVVFSVKMTDNDSGTIKSPKNGTTTFRLDNTKASGAVTYPGTVSTSSLGSNNGFIST